MSTRVRLVAALALGAMPLLAAAQASIGSTQASTGSSIGSSRTFERLPKATRLGPGVCELWFPDRPIESQPPPGDCARVSGIIPPGAWLLIQPAGDDRHVHAIAFDDRRPGAIRAIAVFDALTGEVVKDARSD